MLSLFRKTHIDRQQQRTNINLYNQYSYSDTLSSHDDVSSRRTLHIQENTGEAGQSALLAVTRRSEIDVRAITLLRRVITANHRYRCVLYISGSGSAICDRKLVSLLMLFPLSSALGGSRKISSIPRFLLRNSLMSSKCERSVYSTRG